MGIIYNNNVEESKIYQAYGLTVYGKINSYEWIIDNYRREDALITIRITDTSGNDIFSMYMGNNCILQCRIDDTLDNFLWWITEDKPDTYTIERKVYSSLCANNCIFNSHIQNRKIKQKREEEEKKRIAERKTVKAANMEKIKVFCEEKSLFPYCMSDYIYLVKMHNEKVKNLFELADNERMETYIKFMKQHSDNKDAHIVKDGTIEEILNYIA